MTWSWMVGSDDAGERGVDFVELGQEQLEDLAAVLGKFVETLLAIVFFAPFAFEQALRFETAKERVKGAFVDLDSERSEILAEGVPVMLPAQLGEDGDDEQSPAQFQPEIIKEIGVRFSCHYQVSNTM